MDELKHPKLMTDEELQTAWQNSVVDDSWNSDYGDKLYAEIERRAEEG